MAQKVNIDKFIASLIQREREALEMNDDQLTEYESILFEQGLIYKNGEIVELDPENAPEPSSEPEYHSKFKEGDIVRNKVTGDTVKIEEVDLYNRVYYYCGWDGAATVHSDFGFHDEDLWELKPKEIARESLTDFEDALQDVCEMYLSKDAKGELEFWNQSDAFVKEWAPKLLEAAKKELAKNE